MQLGPDKKIYVATTHSQINVIDNPDIEGTGCGYMKNVIDLGASSETSFPTFIQSFFNTPIIVTGNCELQTLNFSIQNTTDLSSVEWNFGDPASGLANTSNSFSTSHSYTAMGSYRVQVILRANTGCTADTVYRYVQAGPLRVDLGNDTILCQGKSLQIDAEYPKANYLWSTGDVSPNIHVTQAGKYWVKSSLNSSCFTTDTIEVAYNIPAIFSLGKDTVICENSEIFLSPRTAVSNVTYEWNTGSADPQLKVNQAGVYWLTVKDLIGCMASDTVNVSARSLPKFSLGNDTILCQTSLQLDATVSGTSMYQWSTGATDAITAVRTSGEYWARVTKDDCMYSDTIQINFKPYPLVNLGRDTAVCAGTTIYLDAQNSGSTYLWNDRSTSQTLRVTETGLYNVQVTNDACTSSDSVAIRYDQVPNFTLGPDVIICPDQQVALKPTIFKGDSSLVYHWSDGSSGNMTNIHAPGLYRLTIKNYCGNTQDSIFIKRGLCKLLIPNAFSPNNDGRNDFFKPGFGENVTHYKLEVYSRWGQKLFESFEIGKGWDGRFNSMPQSNGEYVWIIRYRAIEINEEQVLKGIVMLIR